MRSTVKVLLVDGVGVQAALSLMIWAAVCYQVIHGQAPSEFLVGAGGTVLGYYFHSLARQSANGNGKGNGSRG